LERKRNRPFIVPTRRRMSLFFTGIVALLTMKEI